MKKLLLKLIGDAFIKALVLKAGNKIADKLVLWIFKVLHDKFGHRPAWEDLKTALLQLNIEDFFKRPETQHAIDEICHECKKD